MSIFQNLISKLNEVAGVNINTGNIVGCENGSEEFYHEQGHLEFQKSSIGQNLQFLFESSQIYLMGSLAISFFISFFKYISMALFLFMLFCIIYEEYWCNDYAKEKVKNGKINMDKKV